MMLSYYYGVNNRVVCIIDVGLYKCLNEPYINALILNGNFAFEKVRVFKYHEILYL